MKIELKTPDGWLISLELPYTEFGEILVNPDFKKAMKSLLDHLKEIFQPDILAKILSKESKQNGKKVV